jgi:RNase P/RNase MRP subunit p30
MFVDIVFPNNNEKGFIQLANRLGYGGLCFVYRYCKKKEYREKIIELQKNTKLKLHYGFIIPSMDIDKIKKPKNLIFIKGSDKNRAIIEKKKADVLFSLENQSRSDFVHHRASGLNHVLCKLANKNKIIVGFSFNTLLKNKENLSQLFGRVMQNIRLCRKYKIKTLIGSFAEKPLEMRSVYDLSSLFSILGMGKKEIKNSLNTSILIKPKLHT